MFLVLAQADYGNQGLSPEGTQEGRQVG